MLLSAVLCGDSCREASHELILDGSYTYTHTHTHTHTQTHTMRQHTQPHSKINNRKSK